VSAALTQLRAVVPGLPSPPSVCHSRMLARPRSLDPACREPDAALARLAETLAVAKPAARDRRLWQLERCSAFPPGLIRALRAELDPSCGDVIVEPLLADAKPPLNAEIATTLLGLAYAAHLQRAVKPLKPFKGVSRDELTRFLDKNLIEWRDAQVQRGDSCQVNSV
jgi:hypothetical protein